MADSNLARLVPADEPLQDERLQDELAQFISAELRNQDVQISSRPKPSLTLIQRRLSLWSWRPLESRLSRRRIHIDDGMFSFFRVR